MFSTLRLPACFTDTKAPVIRRIGASRRNGVLDARVFGAAHATSMIICHVGESLVATRCRQREHKTTPLAAEE